MEEKKQAAEAVQKAKAGVQRAAEAAERGELISKTGARMSPAQIKNLRPGRSLDEMPPEKLLEVTRAGQRASVEAQTKRRTIREIYSVLLEQPDSLEGIEDAEIAARAQETARQRGKSLTLYEAIAVAMAAKAKAGDVKAAVFVRDSAGDKPADTVELTAETVTDADRRLMQKIAERLKNNDTANK